MLKQLQKQSTMNQKKLLLLTTLFLPFVASAKEATKAAGENEVLTMIEYVIILFAIATVLFMVITLGKMWKMVMRQELIRTYAEKGIPLPETTHKESFWSSLTQSLTNSVPLEKEEDILMDHDYDGIRELDNSLPPWWLYMFYFTIAFAVFYIGYYHVFAKGPLQIAEYNAEMKVAEEAKTAYLAKQANKIDENNVTLLTDAKDLDVGKSIFKKNCVVCHGENGEGGVGPNFTDEYWLHGGGISDIFKTIKYGVPDKGMISWKDQMSLSDIQKVASYIKTFKGTNPPNGKAPQGEKYEGD